MHRASSGLQARVLRGGDWADLETPCRGQAAGCRPCRPCRVPRRGGHPRTAAVWSRSGRTLRPAAARTAGLFRTFLLIGASAFGMSAMQTECALHPGETGLAHPARRGRGLRGRPRSSSGLASWSASSRSRRRKASTILTSNHEPVQWLTMSDALLAQSAVDRITAGAAIEGPSYRQRTRPEPARRS